MNVSEGRMSLTTDFLQLQLSDVGLSRSRLWCRETFLISLSLSC